MSPMKKIISTVAALVLTLAMSVTAFAAPSVTAPSSQTPANNGSTTTSGKGSVTHVQNYSAAPATATDANGNPVTIQVTSLTAAQTAEAQAEVVAVFGGNVDVFAAADYDVTGASASNPITVVFSVGVSNGDTVWVLHKRNDGNWYKENATAADGKVTAVFTSFSPMVIVRETAVASEKHYHSYADTVVAPTATTWGYTMHTCACGDSYTDSYVAPLNGASDAVSPKTADNGVAGFAVIAIACLGALICVNRKKFA